MGNIPLSSWATTSRALGTSDISLRMFAPAILSLLSEHHQIAARLVADLDAERLHKLQHGHDHGRVDLERHIRVPVWRLLDGDDVGIAAPDVQRHTLGKDHIPSGHRLYVYRGGRGM